MNNTTRTTLVIVFLGFLALNVYGFVAGGLQGALSLIEHGNAWSLVFASDLVIALGLAVAWMVKDARGSGRAVSPYVLLTMTTGSIGPLLYLIRKRAA